MTARAHELSWVGVLEDPGTGRDERNAKVAKLADAPDLGSGGATHGGSSPPFRTNNLQPIPELPLNHCAQNCAHLGSIRV
jgi:hypothetical protein